MSNEERSGGGDSSEQDEPSRSAADETKNLPAPRRELLPLPGLAAISLYLLVLAVVIIVGVVGGHYPAVFLLLPVFLFAACGGLLMLFRWAWAMALAAVLMLGGYNVWVFAHLHMGPALIQGLLNLVFFFYLVRPEVREKLR
ncbi:MAG: hypothetical protein WBQ95_09880 [Terracidiphilus sp.]